MSTQQHLPATSCARNNCFKNRHRLCVSNSAVRVSRKCCSLLFLRGLLVSSDSARHIAQIRSLFHLGGQCPEEHFLRHFLMFQIILLKVALISNTNTDFIIIIILNIFIDYFLKNKTKQKITPKKKQKTFLCTHATHFLIKSGWKKDCNFNICK